MDLSRRRVLDVIAARWWWRSSLLAHIIPHLIETQGSLMIEEVATGFRSQWRI
jgi:hypothetical protein